MRTHLTIEELKKYMDTTDMSEEYLFWMEEVSDHLETCEVCQKNLEKVIMIENTFKEESFPSLVKVAEQEEEIRRSMVACKLQLMYQEESTRDVASAIVAEAIYQLQMNAVKSYMLQMSAMAGCAGVVRGEADSLLLKKEDGIEIVFENSELLVKVDAIDKQKKCMVVLDCKEKSLVVCEASWEEENKQWIAKFGMNEVMEQFEVYIIK